MRFARFLAVSLLLIGASLRAQTPPANPAISGVMIVSIDGLRPDVLLRADAPNIRKLMATGSFTMWARTTPQSITLPSHVSMVTGVSPSVHGIEWNADLPLAEQVFPRVPTLFELAHRAGFSTGIVVGKSKMICLAPAKFLDAVWIPPTESGDDAEVAAQAIEMIRTLGPQVQLVHFPNVDNVGHGVGWGTDEQLAAVHRADALVGEVLGALRAVGRLDSTFIIVTSDHGGTGRSHGPDDVRSRSIPWIAAGPGVRANFDLTRLGPEFDVQTYDTFATACAVLGLKSPRRVHGKAIVEIFEQAELLQPAVPRPRRPSTSPATTQSR